MAPDQSYHIYNHANGSENIFREEENYRYFLQQYIKYLGEVVDTYAYCLMPNHFHFLVGVRPEEALRKTFPKFETLEKFVPKRFSNFFSSYTQSFNKVYERKGSLFIKISKENPFKQNPNGRKLSCTSILTR
ncbi:transposase [Negadavirga shengliensis]|uniref:Transposase n=1 Tax=Negadavirga shengliensis TaxID=1389218 RepID=A0ABV9SWB0_9BACT